MAEGPYSDIKPEPNGVSNLSKSHDSSQIGLLKSISDKKLEQI